MLQFMVGFCFSVTLYVLLDFIKTKNRPHMFMLCPDQKRDIKRHILILQYSVFYFYCILLSFSQWEEFN